MKNNKKYKFVNKLFLYGILVPLLSVTLPAYSMQQAEAIELNSDNIENICCFLGVITGIIFIIFSLITSGFIAILFKKLAFKKCGNEKILFCYQPLVSIGIYLHFLFGYIFGSSTLSLYILPALRYLEAPTLGKLLLFTLWGILAILCLNYFQYVTLVLTDKRALFYVPFFGSEQMFLKDIENCYRDKQGIVLIDKCGHRLGFYNKPKKDADKFYQLLTDNLKGRIDNE